MATPTVFVQLSGATLTDINSFSFVPLSLVITLGLPCLHGHRLKESEQKYNANVTLAG